MARMIRTESDHRFALARLDELMLLEPQAGTEAADELDILAVLIADYESRAFPIGIPSAIDAIQFRMDQLGVGPSRLAEILGSKSRASEVLSGKRGLSVKMIRAIHEELGIPAAILIGENADDDSNDSWWKSFQYSELLRRDWIPASKSGERNQLLRDFLGPLTGGTSQSLAFRRTLNVRGSANVSEAATLAWLAGVRMIASRCEPLTTAQSTLSVDLARTIAKLSAEPDGPRRAFSELRAAGVTVVCAQQLPRTRIDGAAMRLESGRLVIALSLRHDRVDNFWFTLLHEFAHALMHLDDGSTAFVDEVNENRSTTEDSNKLEEEADTFAREILVPTREWSRSAASRVPSQPAVEYLASQLGVHSAVVAGRARFELGNYRILNELVGVGRIRSLFSQEELLRGVCQ